MEWKYLLSNKRFGQEQYGASTDRARSDFQRDYDRLIFSSPFRRLQNKTQVFPLPGSVFVHNRLTHSLEVASVARSMANIFLNSVEEHNPSLIKEVPLINEVGNIVAAAALAHDLGNPAFGHSGEAAISRYFTDGDGRVYQNEMSEAQWHDFINFEGNANAIRILTHPLKGKGNDAYALTYSTLASIAKYPCTSIAGKQKGMLHRKKYGFFQSEEESFKKIAAELQLAQEDNEYLIYKRHPLVYLVEAADDICYSIIDLEDAHRLKILSYDEVKNYLLPFSNSTTIEGRLKNDYEDDDAKIGLLRAKAINTLTNLCAGIFFKEQERLLKGELNQSLTDMIPEPYLSAWKAVEKVSVERIYNFSSVIQKEVAGYKIMAGLLEEFVPALIHNNTHYYKKLVKLIPKQYHTDLTDIYSIIQSVLDFVSGMTDLYAVDLYRNIKGISFPSET